MTRAREERKQILVIAQGPEGIDLALVGHDEKRLRVRGHEQLLVAVADLLPAARRPEGIVALGRATRFSESRSVATIANVLGFAWGVPVAASAAVPPTLRFAPLARLLAASRGPIRPAYSGKPHITRPKTRNT